MMCTMQKFKPKVLLWSGKMIIEQDWRAMNHLPKRCINVIANQTPQSADSNLFPLPTHDFLQLWAYQGRKVKPMLDNDTIMGNTLEPLRPQKGFSHNAACLSRISFMPQQCVNKIKSTLLSRTQEGLWNVFARSHSDVLYCSGYFIKVAEELNVLCCIIEGRNDLHVIFRLVELLKALADVQCWVPELCNSQ